MKDNILTKLKNNLWVVVLDIIAVNAAFVLALLLRYYVHQVFYASARRFLDVYIGFAPYYTVICLLIFFVFGLYDGMWAYAGISDMNRIILANTVTAVVNVLGTKLFFGDMPKSYYIVGGLLQFLMTAGIRFSYRAFRGMRERNTKMKTWTIPAMVVGTGDCARKFIRYLEERTVFEVVMIVGKNSGSMMNGIPIVDSKSMPMWISYHDIKTVFLADEKLTQQEKEAIREAAKGAEIKDYIEYLTEMNDTLWLDPLLTVMDGPVTILLDGKEQQYASAKECRVAMRDQFEVKRVRGTTVEVKKV